jgi:AcrR family transcriptional regulator
LANTEAQAGIRLERAAFTRAALIKAARQLFAEKGYHATGTHDVVALAGVSRGALYHHFQDKEALFEAVFREEEDELQLAAATSVQGLAFDPWRQLQEGLQAFLGVIAINPGTQRILLLDGPVVLGWPKWRELESEFTLGHLLKVLGGLMERGTIATQPVAPLAHLVLAALNEAALLIAHSEDPEGTRAHVGEALRVLVAGLRRPEIASFGTA